VLSNILEYVGNPIADKVADGAGDANAPRLGQCLQPRADIDGSILGDISEADRNAEREALVRNGLSVVALENRVLHLDGTAHRLDRAGEFDEHAAAAGFHDPTVMLSDLWIDDLAAKCLQALKRSLLARRY
jgi:hypothetical protein